MQRHDEVIDGAGACHVEQAPALGVAHLFVDRLVVDEHPVVALAGEHPRVGVPDDAGGLAPLRLGGEPRHDRDRELEALGRVHRHHPHRIVVVLGQDRVGHPTLGGLQRRPVQVAPQPVAAGVGPRPRLLDDITQTAPHVTGVAPVEREIEHPALVGHRPHEVGR